MGDSTLLFATMGSTWNQRARCLLCLRQLGLLNVDSDATRRKRGAWPEGAFIVQGGDLAFSVAVFNAARHSIGTARGDGFREAELLP